MLKINVVRPRLLRALRSVRLTGYVSWKHSMDGSEDTRIRILLN
jgi:hypothetical protein